MRQGKTFVQLNLWPLVTLNVDKHLCRRSQEQFIFSDFSFGNFTEKNMVGADHNLDLPENLVTSRDN